MSDTEQAADGWNVAEDDGVLDASDTLDDSVGDPLDTGIAAADHWTAANRFGTTAAEERAGDSLAHLLAQEEPDVDPYAEEADGDEDELTRRGYERETRSGRLVADDQGFGEDAQADSVAWDVGIDGGAASAEEAAVHVVDDPSGPGDGPLR
ncbi:DUF5709 domain-containing protein [Micromonospora sp. WMMC241]|uniref:DUF5709 domain-containing protein n=1 Tax=Micromonospora sp. WMMC241 TaxID=3015159 RepID=UPI0022B5E97F|nr:DUF5709 domain-containing protein [Micromonospora sp. WMMC241]MCZ7438669.1 DUF5709 domain-containing protein [Micromonospora sp. WMMC241]